MYTNVKVSANYCTTYTQKVLTTLVVTTTIQITHTSVVVLVVTTKVTNPISVLVVRTHAKTILVHCTSQHI